MLWSPVDICDASGNVLYFQAADVIGHTRTSGYDFIPEKCPYYDYKSGSYTKYIRSDNKQVLEPDDDAAHVLWGGNWRMPTLNEYRELITNTNFMRMDHNGEYYTRFLFTTKRDTLSSAINFYPGGFVIGTLAHNSQEANFRISETLAAPDDMFPYINANGIIVNIADRHVGIPIRPVCEP